jgi:hypothetical protein
VKFYGVLCVCMANSTAIRLLGYWYEVIIGSKARGFRKANAFVSFPGVCV